jgi:hypothetical protein
MNQFLVAAAAEKMAALLTEDYWPEAQHGRAPISRRSYKPCHVARGRRPSLQGHGLTIMRPPLSRDRRPLRADFANFFRYALQTPSASGNVFRLHFRLLVRQRDCTKHLLRVCRHRDDGYREHEHGSLRPRNFSVPSYRPTQRRSCTAACAS